MTRLAVVNHLENVFISWLLEMKALDGADGQLIRWPQVYFHEKKHLWYFNGTWNISSAEGKASELPRDLLKYLDVVFGYQSSFPSQVTQEPFFIDGLQIGYYIPNLRERQLQKTLLMLEWKTKNHLTCRESSSSLSEVKSYRALPLPAGGLWPVWKKLP